MAQKMIKAAFTGDYVDENGELAFGDIGLDKLDEAKLVDYSFMKEYHDVLQPGQIADIDVLFLHGPDITRETFAKGAEKLTFIARCGIGLDSIDVAACTENDVLLANTPLVNLPTASSALMYLLVLGKNLRQLDILVRNNEWDERTRYKGIDLKGRTLGIVGFGNIGRELVRLVKPFDMTIIAYDPHVAPGAFEANGAKSVSLDTLMSESDFVSIHCGLTEETRGLIGRAELGKMKREAFIVNTARGPVIDYPALLEVLTEKRIAGAGLDVLYREPLPKDDPITKL
ncbi:MAG: hypothetical protein MI751_02630, partial [Pseudomonadales bacterium]|nr:hypothetical protein [Pseudomonadales bacterium]